MIQSEAFRCKGITEKLLDFSRIGPPKRQPTDLRELVQGVLDVIGHLGKYHGKQIAFCDGPAVLAPVNGQELKQVVLNLLTNALDSLDDDGRVDIRLETARADGRVERGRQRLRHGRRSAGADLRAVLHPPPRRAGNRPGAFHLLSHRLRPRRHDRGPQPGAGAGSHAFVVRLPLTAARRSMELAKAA